MGREVHVVMGGPVHLNADKHDVLGGPVHLKEDTDADAEVIAESERWRDFFNEDGRGA